MSYHKLIHDYLAGELSSEEEEKLFDGLSRHPEWREEMQLQRQMERAMEQDLHSVTVPPHATGAVFASLGFKHRRGSGQAAKWSPGAGVLARDPASLTRTAILSGLAGMLLLAGSAYFIFPSHNVATNVGQSSRIATSPRAIAQSMNGAGAGKQAIPVTRGNERVMERGMQNTNPHSPLAARHSPLVSVPKPNPASLASSDSVNEATLARPPNEPLRYYFDIGNLYSVHYLTLQKIIGVSDHGQIFVSEDSGHSWAVQTSGTSNDLYGVHFIDTLNGVAVGSQGTILLTTNAGENWRGIASGTTQTLSTVRYQSRDTIYICGESGAMLRSTTGGTSWKMEQTGIHANLFRLMFGSGSNVDAYGASGAHIATTDGGETWNTIK